MEILIILYFIGLGVTLLVGGIMSIVSANSYSDDYDRRWKLTARLFFFSPVWPAMVVCVVFIFLRWIARAADIPGLASDLKGK